MRPKSNESMWSISFCNLVLSQIQIITLFQLCSLFIFVNKKRHILPAIFRNRHLDLTKTSLVTNCPPRKVTNLKCPSLKFWRNFLNFKCSLSFFKTKTLATHEKSIKFLHSYSHICAKLYNKKTSNNNSYNYNKLNCKKTKTTIFLFTTLCLTQYPNLLLIHNHGTSRGDGYSYPTSSDQSRVSTSSPTQRYDAMGDTTTSRLDGNPTDKLIGASPLDTTNHHHNQSPHQVRSTSVLPTQLLQIQPPSPCRDELNERQQKLANGQSLDCSTPAAMSSPDERGVNGAAVYIEMIGDHPLTSADPAKGFPRPPNGDLPV